MTPPPSQLVGLSSNIDCSLGVRSSHGLKNLSSSSHSIINTTSADLISIKPPLKLLAAVKLPVTVPAWSIVVITDYVLSFTFCHINHRFVKLHGTGRIPHRLPLPPTPRNRWCCLMRWPCVGRHQRIQVRLAIPSWVTSPSAATPPPRAFLWSVSRYSQPPCI